MSAFRDERKDRERAGRRARETRSRTRAGFGGRDPGAHSSEPSLSACFSALVYDAAALRYSANRKWLLPSLFRASTSGERPERVIARRSGASCVRGWVALRQSAIASGGFSRRSRGPGCARECARAARGASSPDPRAGAFGDTWIRRGRLTRDLTSHHRPIARTRRAPSLTGDGVSNGSVETKKLTRPPPADRARARSPSAFSVRSGAGAGRRAGWTTVRATTRRRRAPRSSPAFPPGTTTPSRTRRRRCLLPPRRAPRRARRVPPRRLDPTTASPGREIPSAPPRTPWARSPRTAPIPRPAHAPPPPPPTPMPTTTTPPTPTPTPPTPPPPPRRAAAPFPPRAAPTPPRSSPGPSSAPPSTPSTPPTDSTPRAPGSPSSRIPPRARAPRPTRARRATPSRGSRGSRRTSRRRGRRGIGSER